MSNRKIPPGFADGYQNESGLIQQLEDLAVIRRPTKNDGYTYGKSFLREGPKRTLCEEDKDLLEK